VAKFHMKQKSSCQEPGWRSQYGDELDDHGSIPGRGKGCFSSRQGLDRLWGLILPSNPWVLEAISPWAKRTES
jgi:hypothetical protein